MSKIRNNVQLIGNLGADPEVKTMTNGNKLAKFSVAIHEYLKNAQGEKTTETYWHYVVAWGKTAEYAERNLAKGKEVVLSGKLVNRSYVDKEGNKKYVTEVVANDIFVPGPKA